MNYHPNNFPFYLAKVTFFMLYCGYNLEEVFMISVGVKELKAKLSSYIAQAKKGQEIIITEHGKDVAVMLPLSKERQAVKSLMAEGKTNWSGGKPKGLIGIKIKGKPLARTVLEERR
jgi:prevent-host-death family protein